MATMKEVVPGLWDIQLNHHKIRIAANNENDGIFLWILGAGKIVAIPDGSKNGIMLKRLLNDKLG